MAYLLTHFWPGGTEEQYRATVAVVHPAGGLPAGQTQHFAGPTEGGWLVCAVWEDRASCDRFMAEALSQLPFDGSFQGPPQERTTEVVALQNA